MAIVALDKRLADLVDLDAVPEKIAGGFSFTEGPLWNMRDKSLLFVDLQFANPEAGVIHRWTPSGGTIVFRAPSQNTNGNTFDLEGRLISCVGSGRELVRTNHDGSIETLAETYNGQQINAPNDVICCSNGDIIFTDPVPVFSHRQFADGEPEPLLAVYRVSSEDGALSLLTNDVMSPNGLVISDDGTKLWVDNSREQLVHLFDVNADGSITNGRVFCEIKNQGLPAEFASFLDAQVPAGVNRLPDGMKMDVQGNLYVTSNRAEGGWVFDPQGALLGCIGVGEEKSPFAGGGAGGPANLAWGDDDWRTLYITAVSSVYRLRMKVPGQPVH